MTKKSSKDQSQWTAPKKLQENLVGLLANMIFALDAISGEMFSRTNSRNTLLGPGQCIRNSHRHYLPGKDTIQAGCLV